MRDNLMEGISPKVEKQVKVYVMKRFTFLADRKIQHLTDKSQSQSKSSRYHDKVITWSYVQPQKKYNHVF